MLKEFNIISCSIPGSPRVWNPRLSHLLPLKDSACLP